MMVIVRHGSTVLRLRRKVPVIRKVARSDAGKSVKYASDQSFRETLSDQLERSPWLFRRAKLHGEPMSAFNGRLRCHIRLRWGAKRPINLRLLAKWAVVGSNSAVANAVVH